MQQESVNGGPSEGGFLDGSSVMDGSSVEGGGSLDGGSSLEGSQPKLPEIKKRLGVAKDNIDLILFAREKKWSLQIPSCIAPHGERMRVAYIEDGETKFDHLVGEVQGTRYNVGLCARPELEVHHIGVGARSLVVVETEEVEVVEVKAKKGKKAKAAAKKAAAAAAAAAKKAKKKGKKTEEVEVKEVPTDQTDGQGIEVLFDPVKSTYILSPLQEDQLILLFRNDPVAALRVHAAFLRYYDTRVNCMTNQKSRLWRRFVRAHLLDKIYDEARFELLVNRAEDVARKAEEANKVWAAEELSSDEDSQPESNPEEEEEVVVEKVPKKKEKDKEGSRKIPTRRR